MTVTIISEVVQFDQGLHEKCTKGKHKWQRAT